MQPCLKNYKTLSRKILNHEINGESLTLIINPKDFDPTRQYPLLMFNIQKVSKRSQPLERTTHYWHQLLVQKAILWYVMEEELALRLPLKKYKELTKYETEDQIAAAKVLGEHLY